MKRQNVVDDFLVDAKCCLVIEVVDERLLKNCCRQKSDRLVLTVSERMLEEI